MNPTSRLHRLRQRMDQHGFSALLVQSPETRRYLTGFTGSNGQVWVTPDRVVLLTDGRYRTQARDQAAVDDVVVYQAIDEGLAPLVREAGGELGFEGEAFTVHGWQRLAGKLGGSWSDATSALAGLRMGKDAAELAAIRAAIARAETAYEEVAPTIGPGAVERDLALELEWAMRRRGSGPLPFEIIAASGPRSAMPHGIAAGREAAAGDPLTLDFGAEADGYYSDMTFAGSIGRHDEWLAEIVGLLREAQEAAIALCTVGTPCREVDRAARAVLEAAGYGDAFAHSLGHGVGLDVHEAPRLSSRSDELLTEGTVVTIEPGIYLAGKGGARVEDMVAVTADGPERLTTLNKDYRVWNAQPAARGAHA